MQWQGTVLAGGRWQSGEEDSLLAYTFTKTRKKKKEKREGWGTAIYSFLLGNPLLALFYLIASYLRLIVLIIKDIYDYDRPVRLIEGFTVLF